MPMAKLRFMLGEMAAARQMPARRQDRVEPVASHDGGGAKQLATVSGATGSDGFSRRPS